VWVHASTARVVAVMTDGSAASIDLGGGQITRFQIDDPTEMDSTDGEIAVDFELGLVAVRQPGGVRLFDLEGRTRGTLGPVDGVYASAGRFFTLVGKKIVSLDV
jgi:hypothetical protein